MRFIIGDITNKVIRMRDKSIYYFDNQGVYRSVPLAKARSMQLQNIDKLWYDGSYNVNVIRELQDKNLKINNVTLLLKVIAMLKEGDTIETFDEYLATTNIEKHEKPSELDRFITKIEKPKFVREPSNQNPNTFDFIYTDVNIIQEWSEDRLTYIQKHKKQIFKMLLEQLEKNKSFQKFGVPINFLKVSRITLRRDSVLEFVLELKEI